MSETDRVEKLLAMLLMHQMQDSSQAQKASVLSRVGFSNPEVATILGTTAKVIGQQLYAQRTATRKAKKPVGKGKKKARIRRRK